MWLPTQAQVNTVGHYAGAIAGTAFAIFGLQAKGISLDQIKLLISELGSVINDMVILIGTASAIYGAVRGLINTSSNGQAALIGANASTIVQPAANGTATVTITDPGMASAALTAQAKAA